VRWITQNIDQKITRGDLYAWRQGEDAQYHRCHRRGIETIHQDSASSGAALDCSKSVPWAGTGQRAASVGSTRIRKRRTRRLAKKVADDIDLKQTTIEAVERIINGMTLTAS
jgi:hypothetical protein